ncbi:MAG: helix-turn-helix transcriptional regulator [Janthinobacterium lividum]
MLVDDAPISLKDLRAALEMRGVSRPYSSLSQFLALGDIAEQLGTGGKGNRREYPPETVDFLAVLIPEFEAKKLHKDHTPGFVRHRLAQLRQSHNSITVVPNAYDIISSEDFVSSELALISSQSVHRLTQTIEDFITAVKDIAPVREDRLLTRIQVAELLACSPGAVRKRVKPVGRGVWRWSDVMRYIRDMSSDTPG